jgi:L-ascorbate metabolism protein UlaG (beta-lactamase superfamily)
MKKSLLILVFIGLILQGCKMISIKQSDKKDVVPKTLQLSPDFKLTSTGAVYVNFANIIKHDLCPASIKIEYKGKIIYIDPLVVGDTIAADYIFITHPHDDHLSLPDIKKLFKKETVIIGPSGIVDKLSDYPLRIVKPGDTLDFGNIKCEAVESYNLKKGFFKIALHPKSAMYVGYILSFDSIKVYHAGDTDFIPEMSEFKDITIALVPIGEGITAMNPHKAAAAINLIKPSIAVPMHYSLGQNSVDTFKSLVNKEIKVEILQLNNKK